MKRKLTLYLKNKTRYELAKEMGIKPPRIYAIKDTDKAFVILEDGKPVQIDYVIERSIRGKHEKS